MRCPRCRCLRGRDRRTDGRAPGWRWRDAPEDLAAWNPRCRAQEEGLAPPDEEMSAVEHIRAIKHMMLAMVRQRRRGAVGRIIKDSTRSTSSSEASRRRTSSWRVLVADYGGSTATAETTRSVWDPDRPDAIERPQRHRIGGGLPPNVDGADRATLRAYRGIAEARQENTPGWRSKLATRVHPSGGRGDARHDSGAEAQVGGAASTYAGQPLEEILGRRQSGRVLGAALQYAMDADNFPLKQRPFVQQDLIAAPSPRRCGRTRPRT